MTGKDLIKQILDKGLVNSDINVVVEDELGSENLYRIDDVLSETELAEYGTVVTTPIPEEG